MPDPVSVLWLAGWPPGVQEADAPHLAVTHLDSLRPDPVDPSEPPIDAPVDRSSRPGDPHPELIDVGSRHFDPRSR